MSEKTDEQRIEELTAKIMKIKAQKEELEEAEKNLRAALADLTTNGDNFVGEFKINRRENIRFDATLAKKNLDEKTLDKISVTKPDATLAKKILSDTDYAKCRKLVGVVVTVGLRDD